MNLTNRTLVAIRLVNQSWDEYTVGYILFVGPEHVLIDEVDENGRSIGSAEIQYKEILGIDIDDRYLRRLERIGKEMRIDQNDSGNVLYRKDGNFWEGIRLIERRKIIVTFFFDNESYATGILMEISKQFFSFRSIGVEGDEDGLAYRLIKNLTGFRYDSAFEKRIDFYFRNSKYFYY